MHDLSLEQLVLTHHFQDTLPQDAISDNYSRQVKGAIWSKVLPTAAPAPELVAVADDVLALLELASSEAIRPEFTAYFVGNELLPSTVPYATCYGGHQFGQWADQLGDGRAINLATVATAQYGNLTLQLKGAGPTPYSRTADGYAVLRSSIREFLCSEAMYALGVPTTRALSLIKTGRRVKRDMFYDGNPAYEDGAVVCRVAPSFTRFGHFELPAARGDLALLKQLFEVTLAQDFPDIKAQNDSERMRKFFQRVCDTTALMIAHWMRVGFVHGVMNTDNMSILGLTIDYGPYGWMDGYEPGFTPNTTDATHRRYRFANQPNIAHWNLAQLANALYPLVNDVEIFKEGLASYREIIDNARKMDGIGKLGLIHFEPDDEQLLADLNTLLQQTETDMTIFYRQLADVNCEQESDDTMSWLAPLAPAFYSKPSEQDRQHLTSWMLRYRLRVEREKVTHQQRRARMNALNPKYILRNYLSQQAIDAATNGDYSVLKRLHQALKNPYQEQPEFQDLYALRPEWARDKAGCSMLSCSS